MSSKRCAGTAFVSKVRERRQRRKCEICGLREAHLTDDSIHFAVFPRDENRCREWLRIVGNVELTHLPIEKLHQLKRVCSLHFKRRDFNRLGNRLKKHAVPSHNLPIPPLTESQLANFPQHIRKSQGSSVVLNEQLQNQENILQAVPSGSGVNSQKHIASEKPVLKQQNAKKPKKESDENHPSEGLMAQIKTTIDSQRELGVKPQQEQIKLSNVPVSTMLLDHNYSKYYNPKEKIPPVVEHRGAKNPNERCSESLHDEEPPTKIIKTTVALQKLDMSSKIQELTQELRKTKCNLTALKKSAKLIHNLKSDVLKQIVTLALSNQNKKPKGRRWTIKNKISALSIFVQVC